MKITITDIKAIMKRKLFSYANCNLSTSNPYYVNAGAINHAKGWFNDFKEIKNLPEAQIKSIEKHFSNLESKYLFG